MYATCITQVSAYPNSNLTATTGRVKFTLFSQRVRYLLLHQSCLDASVCILGTALLLDTHPQSDTTDDRQVSAKDHVSCYVWHSQVGAWIYRHLVLSAYRPAICTYIYIYTI